MLERAAQADPDDTRCRQLEAIALGRVSRFEEAREKLRRLAPELSSSNGDGETWACSARTWKDEWTAASGTRIRSVRPIALAAARDTAATLRQRRRGLCRGIPRRAGRLLSRHQCADPRPAVGARHRARESSVDLDADRRAACAGPSAAPSHASKDYWALVTRAELRLVEGKAMRRWTAMARRRRWPATSATASRSNSSRQQLWLSCATLDFRPTRRRSGSPSSTATEQQLDALLGGTAAAGAAEPAKVVLFSGHMIDDPARSAARARPSRARFPPRRSRRRRPIRAALDEIGAGSRRSRHLRRACGRRPLFAEACLARGMRVELRSAQPGRVPARSVTFADPDHRWERSFAEVAAKAPAVLVMDEELGPLPKGVDKYDRCNRWMLYTALALGVTEGLVRHPVGRRAGDGPGGTEHMQTSSANSPAGSRSTWTRRCSEQMRTAGR